jgi:hypothetical protein
MAGNSGGAISLGVKRLPVQMMRSDSGDSGEDVIEIQHGYFLREKMGET